MIMSCTPDTSSCFYGDQGANGVVLLRTVLLTADKRVERESGVCEGVCVCVCEAVNSPSHFPPGCFCPSGADALRQRQTLHF